MNISLCRPVPGGIGRVSQWFGERPDAYARFGLAGHNGLDYAVPMGTPVLAAHDGVLQLGDDPAGYGIYAKIIGDHIETIYAHLSGESGLAVGGPVDAGEIIGWSGNTGNSTGPHLHFGLRIHGLRNPAYSNWVDPVPFRDV